MPLAKDAVLAQLDALVTEAKRASKSMPDDELQAIATRCVAAVERLSPPNSDYVRRARSFQGFPWYVAEQTGGVLQGLRADIEAGYLTTVQELVHADVFSDFLDMATELQRSGYKDAAAVIAGSTLEEHLRKLAAKHGVAVTTGGKPVKADKINADLTKIPAYNALVQKQVTAWLDLRNKAAHGHYGEYDDAQVSSLISGVLDFTIKHPA